jgi:hypothetical protein
LTVTVVVVLSVVVLLAIVVGIVSGPLRHPERTAATGDPQRPALEAAKEAKYREIRDAELDFRTGKLSREDYRALDSQLRAEAVDILHQLDAMPAGAAPPDGDRRYS